MGDTDFDTLLEKIAATPRRYAPARPGAGTERYEFRERLGKGAFGEVYEARDRQTGTIVAIKRLRGPDPSWVYRFKREYRVVSELSHPNIIRLYELFCEKDQWYLTMELVRGRRLNEHLSRAPEELRSCFTQIATAIDVLHRSGCLHRDIKPSNVIVEPTGRAVLLDFGLARERWNPTATAVAGTPPYMAPELGMGEEPTETSDWYAFGTMLYEAIAGELPFDGTESQILQAKLVGEPTPPRSPDEEDLERLALALLSPVSSDRPSADDILSALQEPLRERSGRGGAEPADLPVVGRDHELWQLEDALARSRTDAVVATVHGDPGMGKSALVQIFATRAASGGAKFYAGSCREMESLPFKGLDDVIDALCADLLSWPDEEVAELVSPEVAALVRMFPVLKRVRALARVSRDEMEPSTPHGSRRTARSALRELMSRLSRRDPVVLFVDDLQWANDDSVSMLLDLFAPPAPPILVVVAYRQDSRGKGGALDRFLMGIVDRPGVARVDIPVGPLDRKGVEALLAATPELAFEGDRAMRETGGHPYLLARLLGRGGWGDGAPTDIAGVLRAQIVELDQPARRLLEAVSLASRPLSQRAAFGVLGEQWNPILVSELRREKLVQCGNATPDGLIEPYHARVRETVVAEMPDDRRRALHGMFASFLETRGRADPVSLAHHYRLAGENGRALEWLRRAADNALEALAFEQAAELYSDAVDIAVSDPERMELLIELAEAQVQAGHRAAAGHTYVKAAQLASVSGDEERATTMRTRAGEHYMLAGHISKGVGLMADALGAVGMVLPEDTPTAVAATITIGAELSTRGLAFSPRSEDSIDPEALRQLDLQLAVGRALAVSDVRAAWVTSTALRAALDLGEPRRVQRAMANYVFSNCARAPDHPLIAGCVERAFELAEELDDDVGRAWACYGAAMWRTHLADYTQVIELFREARRRFLAVGNEYVREAGTAQMLVCGVLGAYGIDLRTAQRQHLRPMQEAADRDDRYVLNWARILYTWIALARGDVEWSRESVDLALREWPAAHEEMFAALTISGRAANALYEDPGGAWDLVAELRPGFERLFASMIPVTRSVFHRLSAFSALAALIHGRATRAQTVERIEASFEAAQGWDPDGPMNRAIAAMLCAARGDRGGYEDNLLGAADRWDERDQDGLALAARLRYHQSRGDAERVEATVAQWRETGVAEPDRFARLYVGPRVTTW